MPNPTPATPPSGALGWRAGTTYFIPSRARFVRRGQPGSERPDVVAVEPESPLELWIHADAVGGIGGWGLKSRWKRAREAERLLPAI